MYEVIRTSDPAVFQALELEVQRQRHHLELIASENYASRAVMQVMGSHFTNKYAEGYPGKRYYGGCTNVDTVETLARDRAKQIFGAEHANVQPHSGAQANMAVYLAALKPGDTVMGLDLAHGGHLTHGHPLNSSGILYKFVPYHVRKEDEQVDMDEVRALAREHKPKMIVVGASAYSRTWNFPLFREICDEVGALLMVDMAHIAGLVATGHHPSPVPHADYVTTTTHKTLRGPRGGLILCKQQYAKDLDRSVFPGVQGGPLMHVIAAKAIAFHEILQPEFKAYSGQVIRNAHALAKGLQERGWRIVSGGTDNHLFLVDLRDHGLLGHEAEDCLSRAGIRLGSPALTTRGMKEEEMDQIARFFDVTLRHRADDSTFARVRQEVFHLTDQFPIPE